MFGVKKEEFERLKKRVGVLEDNQVYRSELEDQKNKIAALWEKLDVISGGLVNKLREFDAVAKTFSLVKKLLRFKETASEDYSSLASLYARACDATYQAPRTTAEIDLGSEKRSVYATPKTSTDDGFKVEKKKVRK